MIMTETEHDTSLNGVQQNKTCEWILSGSKCVVMVRKHNNIIKCLRACIYLAGMINR